MSLDRTGGEGEKGKEWRKKEVEVLVVTKIREFNVGPWDLLPEV